jgi:hypothetical protein
MLDAIFGSELPVCSVGASRDGAIRHPVLLGNVGGFGTLACARIASAYLSSIRRPFPHGRRTTERILIVADGPDAMRIRRVMAYTLDRTS